MLKPFDAYSAAELLEMLEKKKGFSNRICPMCGNTNFMINDSVLTLPLASGFSVTGGINHLLPVLVSACKNCKNIQFFDITALIEEDVEE